MHKMEQTKVICLSSLRNLYFCNKALRTTPEGNLVIGSSALCGALGIRGNDVQQVFKHASDEALSSIGFHRSKMRLSGKQCKGEINVYITTSTEHGGLSVADAENSEPFKFDEALIVISPLARCLNECHKNITEKREQRSAMMRGYTEDDDKDEDEDEDKDEDEEYVPQSRGTEARPNARVIRAQQMASWKKEKLASWKKEKENERSHHLLQRVSDLREDVDVQKKRADDAERNVAEAKKCVLTLKDDLYYTQKDLERTQMKLERTRKDLERTQMELERTQIDLYSCNKQKGHNMLQNNTLRKQVTLLQGEKAAAIKEMHDMRLYIQTLDERARSGVM